MTQTWRLIMDDAANGPWNMAVDEAILEHAGRGESRPTLRLYAWTPACLSLGYAQHFADVDTAKLVDHGWQVVRRPTGGKAILHTDELTYSVTGPSENEILSGGVLESYNRLAKALLAAVSSLGLPVQVQAHVPGAGLADNGPVCFEVPSAYEITVNGKKLIGSAQSRRKEGVLQHGSLPLYGDLTRITRALVFDSEATRADVAEHLLGRATTVETALGGTRVGWETAAQAFVRAFREALGIRFEDGVLSASETARARDLVFQKYEHDDWNKRV